MAGLTLVASGTPTLQLLPQSCSSSSASLTLPFYFPFCSLLSLFLLLFFVRPLFFHFSSSSLPLLLFLYSLLLLFLLRLVFFPFSAFSFPLPVIFFSTSHSVILHFRCPYVIIFFFSLCIVLPLLLFLFFFLRFLLPLIIEKDLHLSLIIVSSLFILLRFFFFVSYCFLLISRGSFSPSSSSSYSSV